ncbi:MAG: hypothetical protein K2K53_13045, partial [Oscillospiraceae bacterium]|nr:hypothetical protein [Oscillospiraceae bacterium]
MKKRIWAVLLALALSLCPLSAFAAEADSRLVQEDPIPEFVPGVFTEEYEFTYPTYGRGFRRSAQQLPASYDSRAAGYQSAVKSQGSNGLCWAFGTYAAVEANMLKNGMGEHDFSELHM